MSIKFTIQEVHKDHLKVKFDNDIVMPVPIRTWWDKSRIEAEIRKRFNEEDLGNVDVVPFKVGDECEIETTQEQEASYKKNAEDQLKEIAAYTFPYSIIRRIEYPFFGEQLGALVKAVMTGDKTDLQVIQDEINAVKAKYPKDDKKYTMEERQNALNNSPESKHYDSRLFGRVR